MRPVLVASLCVVNFTIESPFGLAENKRFKTSPATEKELMAYFGISTNVFCTAREQGVEFNKAARISISPVFGVIKELHDGKIPGAEKNLSKEQLGTYIDNRLFVTASNACPKFFPKDILKKVDKFKKEVQKNGKKR